MKNTYTNKVQPETADFAPVPPPRDLKILDQTLMTDVRLV